MGGALAGNQPGFLLRRFYRATELFRLYNDRRTAASREILRIFPCRAAPCVNVCARSISFREWPSRRYRVHIAESPILAAVCARTMRARVHVALALFRRLFYSGRAIFASRPRADRIGTNKQGETGAAKKHQSMECLSDGFD